MNNFTTEVELEVNGTDKAYGRDFVVEPQKITIEWGFEMEIRSWGLKGLYTFAPDQKISFTVTEYTDDEDIEHDKEMELKDILVNDDISIGNGLAPQTLVIDLRNNTVELEF